MLTQLFNDDIINLAHQKGWETSYKVIFCEESFHKRMIEKDKKVVDKTKKLCYNK